MKKKIDIEKIKTWENEIMKKRYNWIIKLIRYNIKWEMIIWEREKISKKKFEKKENRK